MKSPVKFLLVDDLEANLVALEGLLKRDGLELLKARSGPEALELLLVHDVALAFLDVQMPEMSGFELAELMRSTERTRRVPIVFLTAGVVDHERRIRGYESGAVDFLPKPIDPNNLLNKAAIFFELAKQREDLRVANEQLAKSNADLERADRSKDEFLAMLAHELRNPLAPLRNSAKILQAPAAKPAERERALAMIDRQLGNLGHMIDDLLDVSRITEGKIELRSEPVELNTVLFSAAEIARASCFAAKQSFELILPPEPVYLEADPTRLEQIVGNLLVNACKYSGEGSHISLSAVVEQNQAIIRVKDNGIGIDPELLPRIFDLFVQASRTIDRAHGGLGIGLTIVNRLVNLHGGTIEAHSDGLGHGSEFIIRLPVLAGHIESAPTHDGAVSDIPTGALKLLIVDDNRDSAESMALLQELNGHETRVAHNGETAVTIALDFLPDVVLLDIGLPGMDGFEVARQMRQSPALRRSYLIAVTGYGSEGDRKRAFAAGFDEHLVKPANLTVLAKLLDQRKQQPVG
ncbi:response regulator [Haloferula sp. BvORR071]|uniref:response regulator n=1 Tax=Haloferula sp. BvORR071 TaxID=1396141 RepID=UPI000556640D|nr:response regulator [Haloferula sp. BvORR071]